MGGISTNGTIELTGKVNLPGDKGQNPHRASLYIDKTGSDVRVRFDEPLGGSEEWDVSSLVITRRLKYNEIVFQTVGLPVESLELIWKMNIALNDRMAAGVVLARPNDLKIKGEHGFTLVAPGEPYGNENYLTQLDSLSYREMVV